MTPAAALVEPDRVGDATLAVRGVTVTLAFPGRRYHATPWGHHVNEGLIEWPPSPWRLLRGFLATGYTKLGWSKEGPPSSARALIEKLAGALPRYRLPNAVGTHSRHYMPMARFKNGREETTMVLDTWAQIDEGTVSVNWAVDLTPSERDVFRDLVEAMGYLGRAESWVEGTLEEDDCARRMQFDVRPGEAKDRPGSGWEQVSLLATLPATEYLAWREGAVRSALEAIPGTNAKGKLLTKGQRARLVEGIERAYPASLVACLEVDTGWLHENGWSQPPGSRRVLYWRRSDSLQGTAPRSSPRPTQPESVDFMLLSLATASGNLHALPSITRTLPQGELLHRALLARGHKAGTAPAVLSGRDIDGAPLRGERAHRHAHLLHLDLDGDGHLDHVLIWAPMRLDALAQRTVRAVRETFAKGLRDPVRLALVAAGSRSDLFSVASPWGDRLRGLLGATLAGSKCWRSVTPFVPPRFLKPRGRNTLEGQVAAELRARGFPEPVSIVRVNPHAEDDTVRKSRHFVRRRGLQMGDRAHAPPPIDCGYVIELEFAEPIPGPIVLGYACHFGLGAFGATGPAVEGR